MWTYNGKRVREGRAWTDDNGVQHPANWHVWSEAEKPARNNARRSITAFVDIPAGTTIKRDMLIMRRPATGLAPDMIDQVVGKKAKIDIQEDTILTLDILY